MEKKVFHVIDEKTLNGEDYETKEAAIEAAWSNWNHLTRQEKRSRAHGYTVYEAVKIWDDDPEDYDCDLYDEILNIHYVDEGEALEEVDEVYEELNDFIKPSLDDIYQTMKDNNLGHYVYDDDTYQDFIDDPEYYIDEVLEALMLIVEVPEIKTRLSNLYAMHIID